MKMTKQHEKWIPCTNISRNRVIIHLSGPKIEQVMLTDGHFGGHFEFGHFLKMPKDTLSLPAMYALLRPLGPQIHWEKNYISQCRVKVKNPVWLPDYSPLSKEDMISLCILSSSVSVLWYFLYADCFISAKLLSLRCLSNCIITAASRAFPRNGKFETGL